MMRGQWASSLEAFKLEQETSFVSVSGEDRQHDDVLLDIVTSLGSEFSD